MNIVWFSPSIVWIVFLFTVRRSSPITPPSKSAELVSKWHPDQSYLAQIKTVMAKAAFFLLLQSSGNSNLPSSVYNIGHTWLFSSVIAKNGDGYPEQEIFLDFNKETNSWLKSCFNANSVDEFELFILVATSQLLSYSWNFSIPKLQVG